ncbi:MAG: hypothetical protein ACJ75T_02160 [Solirubrobacterales bacterium]
MKKHLTRPVRLLTIVSIAFASAFTLSTATASAFSLGLMWMGDYTQAKTEMASIGKSGATLFRVPVVPSQTANGSDWTYYDEVFGNAAKNGVTILPEFQGRLNGQTGLPGAGEKAAWTEWAKQVVRRYGYNGVYWTTHPEVPTRPVIAWELWNEPNNGAFWTISATEFGNFIAWAGPAVQAASESWGGQKTGVLFGGLLSWSGGTNYQTYLKNAYEVPGATGAFTGFAYHPYELDTSQFPGESRTQAFKKAVKGARSFLDGLPGGSGKSLWITETGWPAEAEYSAGDSEQANLLLESFDWAIAEAAGLNLHAIVWNNHRDPTSSPATWQNRSGLRRGNGSYRAAWYAFQEKAKVPRWPIPGPSVRVAYADAGQANSISGWQYGSGTGWQQMFLWGHEVAAGTRPAILGYEEGTHIFFVDANRENRLTEWSWNPVTGWQQNFLETDPVAAGSSPSAILVNGSPQIYFSDAATNRSIALMAYNGSSWQQSRFYGDPVAPNSSPSAISTPGSSQIYFADSAKGNTIAAWVWGSGSLQQSFFYGDPVAPNSSPSAISTPGSSQIYFADSAKGNTIAAWIWNSSLQQSFLYGDPVAPNSSPSAILSGGTSEVFFADGAKSRAVAVWIWGSTLQQVVLGGDSVAPNSSPSAIPNGGSPQIYFADTNTNNSMALWEWTPTTLQQIRLFGHPVATGTSPGA